MPGFPRIAIALVLTSLAAACGNPFHDTYQSSLERWPHGEASRLLPPEKEVQIVTSEKMKEDALRMMEDGYLLLGRSRFRGPYIDHGIARKQAKEIGASVVMIEKKHAETLTETVPVSEWIPGHQVTYTEKTVVQSGPNAGQVVQREVTRMVEGEFQTSYVPESVEYYDYAATFWGKSKPPIFGVLVQALTDEMRQALQTNRGVEIRAVLRNSPAYRADLLRGDVIIAFAGEPVLDVDQFFDAVVANQGKRVALEIRRDGQPMTMEIPLDED